MIVGGIGGATTKTGLAFEKEIDFQELILKIPGYEFKDEKNLAGRGLYFNGELVARCFRKHDFYKFLAEHGVLRQAELFGIIGAEQFGYGWILERLG